MIHIYTARAASDAPALMFNLISKTLENIEQGKGPAKRVLVVVPAQNTLGMEEAAFDHLNKRGFFDLHIISGNKLRSDLIHETGGSGRTAVNTLGRSMLLRKIAGECRDRLKVFSKVAGKTEFLDMAGDFIVQMKQNSVDAEGLNRLISDLEASAGTETMLSKKLSDMQIFASEYARLMEGRFTDSEDELSFAIEKVKESKKLAESEIWYCGFYSFTSREQDFLTELAKHCKGLNIVLECGDVNDPEPQFEAPLAMLKKLNKKAAACGIGLKISSVESEKTVSGDLLHLDRNLFRLPPDKWGKVSCAADGSTVAEAPFDIRLIQAQNPVSQAESIAIEILDAVENKGLKFGDFAILTSDMEGQGQTAKRVLSSYGIPVFTDEKRSIMHSPLAETVSALLDICADGPIPKNVLAFVKPGLVPGGSTDDFANYVKAYHIKGNAFFKPFKYGLKSMPENRAKAIEAYREKLSLLLEDFTKEFKADQSVSERVEKLYTYMNDCLKLSEKLEKLSVSLGEEGLLDASEECAQVFDVFTGLLDQCVELLGDEIMSAADFRTLINESCRDIKIGLLPQSEGKVVLGSVDRSMISGTKHVYITGLNEGLIPKDAASEMLLTQREQQTLADGGTVLCKSSDVLRSEEKFNIYKAMTSAAESLTLMYCLSDIKGDVLRPSSLVDSVSGMFPGLSISEESSEDTVEALKHLDARRLEALREGVLFRNKAQNLSLSQMDALFGAGASREMKVSPSRLEQFAKCPFRHFVSYGLRPEENEDFVVTNREIGDVHHECMLRVSEWLTENRKKGIRPNWSDVTDKELSEKLDEILSAMSENYKDGLLAKGAEERYRMLRIKDVCLRFVRFMILQAAKDPSQEMYFETQFGEGLRFPAVRINTPEGTVRVEGKIDRMDFKDIPEGKASVKIIDYKSKSTVFDKNLVRSGLNLQLMLYLEAALGKGDAKPAGVFYYYINESRLSAELSELAAGEISSDLADMLMKEYKVAGLGVSDGTADGPKGAGFVSAEEFDEFRKEFISSLNALCGRLLQGEIDISPRCLGKDMTACTYCQYRSICSFDPRLKGFRYC